MSDISNIKNIHKITINEDNGMLSPTTEDLTGGKLNRYQIAYGTARGARIITNEYVRQREAAEKAATGNKDADRNLINMINKEYRDEKAVKNAITRINSGEYKIVRTDGTESEIDETETVEEINETENVEATAE